MSNVFNEYPYRNITDLNLDYILNAIKTFQNDVTNFVSINAIKYANPIQWNITNQYEKNTIVIDPQTGTAYISVAAVPSGVALTREEYWTVVFDLGSFVVRAAKNFTSRYEAETTLTATFNSVQGDWLIWGDTLYIANVNITAGDSYVVDGNIRRITAEEVKNAIYQLINENYEDIINLIGELVDLNTSDKTSIVNAINSVLADFDAIIGDLNDLITADKSNIVGAINEAYEHGVNHYANPIIVYVSDLNGNDDNDGSNDAPFKTLDRALKILNRGSVALYVYIKDAATYYIKQQEIGGCTVHIYGQVDGITIKFDTAGSGKFYNCHLNFQCQVVGGLMTITRDYDMSQSFTGWYAENSAVTFTRINIPCGWAAYGGSIAFTDCKINAIWLWSTAGFFQNLTIENTFTNQGAIWLRHNCNISIANTIDIIDSLTANVPHGFIRVERSICRFLINDPSLITIPTMTYNYAYGISGSNSYIQIDNSIYNRLKAVANGVNGTLDGCDLSGLLLDQINDHQSPYVIIPDYANLDDYTTAGMYHTTSRVHSETISNMPYTPTSSFRLDVVQLGVSAHLWQIFTAYNSQAIYIRPIDTAIPEILPWIKIADYSKLDTTAVAPVSISSGTDLNNLWQAGQYRSASNAITASLSNCPYSGSGFKLTNYYTGGLGLIRQKIEGPQFKGFYFRDIALTDNLPTAYSHWYSVEGVDTGA